MSKVINKAVVASAIMLAMSSMNVKAATTYDVPKNSEFKTWMDYREITSRTSEQWKLQQHAVTNQNGFRIYDGRYTIALGTAFNALTGTYADVTLTDGTTIHCVVGDVKRDCDTDWTNMQVAKNGNVVEFITDKYVRPAETTSQGTMSILPGFEAGVDTITIYDSAEEAYADYESLEGDKLVMDKYKIELADETFYFVTYKQNGNVVTEECDRDQYKNTSIGETF